MATFKDDKNLLDAVDHYEHEEENLKAQLSDYGMRLTQLNRQEHF